CDALLGAGAAHAAGARSGRARRRSLDILSFAETQRDRGCCPAQLRTGNRYPPIPELRRDAAAPRLKPRRSGMSARCAGKAPACPRHEAAMSDTTTRPRTRTKPKTERPKLHKVILVNDDYTPREFVV